MIAAPPGVRVYLACGTTDMRRGMAGLAVQVQQVLSQNPFDGAVFAFRGRGGGLIKLLWHDGIGLCLLTKRLERGHFIWPMTSTGAISLTASQLAALLEGCEWRAPVTSRRPEDPEDREWHSQATSPDRKEIRRVRADSLHPAISLRAEWMAWDRRPPIGCDT